MKALVARADERWSSMPSFLDSPDKQQPAPAIGVKDPGGYVDQTEPEAKEGVRSAVGDQDQVKQASKGQKTDEGRFKGKTRDTKENPWNRTQRGAPGEDWQPQQWSPGIAQRR